MMRIHIAALTAFAGLAFSTPLAADQSAPSDQKQKLSYALGYQIGSQIATQIMAERLDLDPRQFARAIEDVLSARPPAISEDDMAVAISAQQQQAQEQQIAMVETNKTRGEAFRATFAEEDGVQTTASGLAYRVLAAGSDKRPGPEATVVVHYRGTLVDGTEFDSSFKRGQPATFSLGGIIPGWQEALQLMGEGARWEVVIPPELGYGNAGAGGLIGPEETLVFEIELLEVK